MGRGLEELGSRPKSMDKKKGALSYIFSMHLQASFRCTSNTVICSFNLFEYVQEL